MVLVPFDKTLPDNSGFCAEGVADKFPYTFLNSTNTRFGISNCNTQVEL